MFCTICSKQGVTNHTHCDSSHEFLTLENSSEENIKSRSESEPELSEIMNSLHEVKLDGSNKDKKRPQSAPIPKVRFEDDERERERDRERERRLERKHAKTSAHDTTTHAHTTHCHHFTAHFFVVARATP